MKWFFYSLMTVCLVIIVGGSIYIYNVINADPSQMTQNQEETQSKEIKSKQDIKSEEAQTEKIGGIKTDLELSQDPTEDEVLEIMHEMTHQKVKADEKWGAVQMTPEHIQTLLELVAKNNFENKDELSSILNKWKKKNFSTVDQDHNDLWSLQGGNVGKAYGILSESEEQVFIKNNFESE
ncbi:MULTISPECIES: DUF6241 domain-containing protein [Terrilactibacillus]|uniref:Uncharacterized protein n=2 Tax=Terrilactibacillus TaxID=1795633 RepID=A0A6N8CRN0_9BACI|nr:MULTISPECIES: DUF6241 domain-containing protein [Terrilactibacillus]MTT32824.1 hypothetical protein [Terrilactibacillus tamarindi]